MPEIQMLSVGGFTSVQDSGRPGHAHLGVPRSGAADRASYALANRLVGATAEAAVLEVTLGGCSMRVSEATSFAVTGAPCEIRVDGRPVQHGSARTVRSGAVIDVGPALQGLRSYVAIGGGLRVPKTLGSRSTDTLSGIGPPPVRVGDRLRFKAGGRVPAWVEVAPRRGSPDVAVRLGPRAGLFLDPQSLDGASYVVLPASNRIGIRLEGPPIERTDTNEIESEPMLLGAIQVLPSGQPVVLLADHATTGGYPVIGVVGDTDALAQRRPGEQVTLRLVG